MYIQGRIQGGADPAYAPPLPKWRGVSGVTPPLYFEEFVKKYNIFMIFVRKRPGERFYAPDLFLPKTVSF